MFKSKLEFFLQLISKANDSHRPNCNNREHAVIGKVYDAVNISHTEIYLYTYLNLTPMSLELISLAVDSMTPPNKPPPLRPRAPIISAERLIIYIRNPTKKT